MSSKDILVSLLSKTELFKGLAVGDIEACVPSFREAKFKKGQALFARGERATGLYLVAEGRVRLAITTEDGRELSFRHATSGELLGEIAALDGGTRSADATALTAVTTYRLDKEDFRKLWTTRPVLSERLIAFLCGRLRETSGQLESIALHPMHVRLARFFLIAIGDRKPVPGKRLPLDLGMSQGELALLLGASRPKINEALGKLEEIGAIGRTLDRIFCDPQKLAEVDGLMLSQSGKTHSGLMAGVLALVLFLAAALLIPKEWRNAFREKAFDMVLAADRQMRRLKPQKPAKSVPVVVVDIDRRSLDALGPWPWPRETMARLVEAVAGGNPSVVGIDILFAQADNRSPAALARQLGSLTGKQDISSLAADLPDGDKHLAAAMKNVPVVLGFVLDADSADVIPGVPVLARHPMVLDDIWRMTGGIGPMPPLVEATKGLGALSLPGDADGKIRRVPLLVGTGDATRPGLALEAVRLFQRSPAYSVDSGPQRIIVGDLEVLLPGEGMLRLAGADTGKHQARTISAVDIVNNAAERVRLAGAIALIGGSAPELGGLRETPSDPLVASVEIQADAVRQIFARRAPQAVPIGFALTLVMGLIAIVAASALSPVLGAFVGLAALAAIWAGAIFASLVGDRLVDPLMPSIGGLFVFLTSSVSSYALVSRREAHIRSRFEQHLAPAVVKRIAENLGLLKLNGEKREITALFTDIEDFTAMTHRAGPEQLVAVLDEYIEGMAAIVMKHGGMVDKIVGDSVHAFFNAPLDLQDHPQHAIDCAEEMRIWTKAFQSRVEPSQIGFGRTRIGIETGVAIVGDIGIRSKLDYTAHGNSINSAARLEALNKRYGSTICVGPFAASRCTATLFRPLGVTLLRGLDAPVEVFEPWPPDTSSNWRERYLTAYRSIEDDKSGAARLFEELAAECPDDPVPRLLAAELRAILST